MQNISGKRVATISTFGIYLQFVEELRYIHRNPVKAGLWRGADFFTRAVTLKTKIIFNPGMAHLSRCSGGVVDDVAAV